MDEHFSQLSQQLSQQLQSLAYFCQGNGLSSGQALDETTQKIDEIAQKKADLQAQINALQLEMETLTT
jgi:hypothetical protein